MKKLTKIRKSIQEINKNDEAGCIVMNIETYHKLRTETKSIGVFGEFGPSGIVTIFGLPLIVENIKEDCLILSKNTLKQLGELYGKS